MSVKQISNYYKKLRSRARAGAAILSLLLMLPGGVAAMDGGSYTQVNLVSDLPGMAPATDPTLVNPWGLSHSSSSPWWISDNGSGASSIYSGSGSMVRPAVTIPMANGAPSGGTPTGTVFNEAGADDSSAFVIKKGTVSSPSSFLFATEDGAIAGWNKNVDPGSAVIAVNRSTSTDGHGNTGAVYKGLAFGYRNHQPYIYATNFRFGTVEMFDKNFKFVKSFSDPKLVTSCLGQCYAPFGIQTIKDKLYVTFALQDADKHDDVAGPGKGYIDVFSMNGKFLRRLASQGELNSPWGLALAPKHFGSASRHLLAGNFGDGTVGIYDLRSGDYDGKLMDNHGKKITISGLWALGFGNGALAGHTNELYFTAGLDGEAHGLFGKITANDSAK